MSRYNIENFKTFFSKLENKNMDDEIFNILTELAKKLNCSIEKNKNKSDNDKYWLDIRNFKTTQIKDTFEDENKYLQNIRKNLNMTTESNYINFIDEILSNLEYIKINFADKYNNICSEIYNLLSNNYLYSKSYSKIFKIIVENETIFNDFLTNEINNFSNFFDNLIYISPDENYEKFCDYNKTNERRRAKILFYANLYLLDIIDTDNIYNLSNIILKKLNEYIDLENKNNEIDEISEYNYLLTTTIYNNLLAKNNIYASNIFKEVTKISNYKIKNYISLTNKCIFKHMDIIDELS